jgi:cysteinyl-tRNA synthetase
MTTDILRRILEKYFGFNIQFIMNITDVDDKVTTPIHLHKVSLYQSIWKDHCSGTPKLLAEQIQGKYTTTKQPHC